MRNLTKKRQIGTSWKNGKNEKKIEKLENMRGKNRRIQKINLKCDKNLMELEKLC